MTKGFRGAGNNLLTQFWRKWQSKREEAREGKASLLGGQSSSEAAARSINAICEPLIKRDPNGWRIEAVWDILCDAVRALGGGKEVVERLVDLLSSIQELPEVTDERGNAIKHAWGGRYWTDLPTWALTFREYGIAIEADDEMEQDAWLAQATPFLNATSFVATYLSRVPSMTGMSFYADSCLREALEGPYETPEPRYRAAMYVPAAAALILLAGKRLYRFCKDDYQRNDSTSAGGDERPWGNGRGFSLKRWAFWKQRFYDVMATTEFESSIRDYAKRAADEMERIEDREYLGLF